MSEPKNIQLLVPRVIDGAVRHPAEGAILVDADLADALVKEKAADLVSETAHKKESSK